MASYIHVPEEAPAVPNIDVTLDERDYRSGALRLIKELRPSWKPAEVNIKVPHLYIISFNTHTNTVRLPSARRRRWVLFYFLFSVLNISI